MIEVVALQYEAWRLARPREIARDGEHEVGAVHVLAKRTERRVGQVGPLSLQIVGPAVEHLAKSVLIFRGETDRVLQDRRGDALRRSLDDAQAVSRTDASAHDVGALDAQMVEQRQVVGGVGRPAIGGGDRRVRLAGVALVLLDTTEVGGKSRGRVDWDLIPEYDGGAHPSLRETQHRKTGAKVLVNERHTRAAE